MTTPFIHRSHKYARHTFPYLSFLGSGQVKCSKVEENTVDLVSWKYVTSFYYLTFYFFDEALTDVDEYIIKM
jgi:hypothetical protein